MKASPRFSGACCHWSSCAPPSRSRSAELRDHDRGALDVDLESLDTAAHRIAIVENIAVFHGWPKADIAGIAEASPHEAIPLGQNADVYPRSVARAVELLLHSGIAGPYGLALGRDEYTRVVETAEHGGYPLLDHLRKILEGPIVWSPGVKGAVVLSLRGGDFLFESGQDLRSATSDTTSRGAPLSGGEFQLRGRDARSRGTTQSITARLDRR